MRESNRWCGRSVAMLADERRPADADNCQHVRAARHLLVASSSATHVRRPSQLADGPYCAGSEFGECRIAAPAQPACGAPCDRVGQGRIDDLLCHEIAAEPSAPSLKEVRPIHTGLSSCAV